MIVGFYPTAFHARTQHKTAFADVVVVPTIQIPKQFVAAAAAIIRCAVLIRPSANEGKVECPRV